MNVLRQYLSLVPEASPKAEVPGSLNMLCFYYAWDFLKVGLAPHFVRVGVWINPVFNNFYRHFYHLFFTMAFFFLFFLLQKYWGTIILNDIYFLFFYVRKLPACISICDLLIQAGNCVIYMYAVILSDIPRWRSGDIKSPPLWRPLYVMFASFNNRAS